MFRRRKFLQYGFRPIRQGIEQADRFQDVAARLIALSSDIGRDFRECCHEQLSIDQAQRFERCIVIAGECHGRTMQAVPEAGKAWHFSEALIE